MADAWGKAFNFLADAFIATESKIREAASEVEGGFTGYKEFTIAKVVEHAPNGAKTFSLAPVGGGPVPPHRGGQYLSFVLEDVEDLGKCKLSAMISDISSEHLVFTVFPNAERPVLHLLGMKEGDVMKTSVPCGPFTLDMDSVGEMKTAIVVGKAEDAGMLSAVAKDLAAAGVGDVKIVIEISERFGDVATRAAGSGIAVESVEAVAVEAMSKVAADGLFCAPSVQGVFAAIADSAEGSTCGVADVTVIS